MRRRSPDYLLVALCVLLAVGAITAPYVTSLMLVFRAAGLGGPLARAAEWAAHPITVHAVSSLPTRAGAIRTRLYEPADGFDRAVLLVPGIHAAGIDEVRLTKLAMDLAGAGVAVLTFGLPDLQAFRITPESTDLLEDAMYWMSSQPGLAKDGKIGVVGVSFAGGLSVVAAGRPQVRNRIAFVVSFGGHSDLPRVMRYLATGQEPPVEGLTSHPPHDYGVAVILYGIAQAVVPPEQVDALRDGVRTFLVASQETLVDQARANRTLQRARDLAATLPKPSRRYLTWVLERNTHALGAVLAPELEHLASDLPALSAERAPTRPAAPVFLLHGAADTVIPAAESVFLRRHLGSAVPTRLLLSHLITHAEVDESASMAEAWRLVAFWADILRR